MTEYRCPQCDYIAFSRNGLAGHISGHARGSEGRRNLPTVEPLSRALVREIAMDIGKEVAAHIETMYPAAVAAVAGTFLPSVRNCVHNEIMAALETINEEEIRARLSRRKQARRKHRAVYRKIRNQGVTEEVLEDA